MLTNWPHAQGPGSGLRRWEEAACRDQQAHGWPWPRRHGWAPEQANRRWWVLALAEAGALSVGTRGRRPAPLRHALTRGKARRRSVFPLGLRWRKRWLARGRRLGYELWVMPHLPALSNSVVQ